MEKLRISRNKRYFETESGKPFLWLADTNWTMAQRMKWDDVEYFMKTRKRQGFTVLQIVALDPERDEKMRTPAGDQALWENDLKRPNEAYFKYLDWILDKAEENGFYVLLLPVWGQLVVGDNWMGQSFPKTVTEENAYIYGQWIGNRYKDRNNIIWCLGGDRQPIHKGVDYRNVWRKMAEGLAKGVLDRDLHYNGSREEWKDVLLTYHACHEAETGECSTMSYWTNEEAWIQFIMLQSGHGAEPKNYELVEKEYNREVTMPVWDGEPAYEAMPTTWPVTTEFHGTWMVRKRAYWALFSGAFGHTYGHANIWCYISEREKGGISICSWYEGLHSEGAGQIKILRDFMEAIDVLHSHPAKELIRQENDQEMDRHIQIMLHDKNDFICGYLPSGGSVRLQTAVLGSDTLCVWWFNPRNGACTKGNAAKEQTFVAPEEGTGKDWILLVYGKEMDVPVASKEYGEAEECERENKVFEW